MPPKSLFELAAIAAMSHIKLVTSVGDLPWDLVKDILAKVDNAEQLRRIELSSEHVAGNTAELWWKLIMRDFPVEYKAAPAQPKDPDKWHKAYEYFKDQHQKRLVGDGEKLQAALADLKESKEKHTSQIIEVSKIPRGLLKGTNHYSGSRPRSAISKSSGASAMSRIKKEASKISSIRNAAPSVAGPPTVRAPKRPQPAPPVTPPKPSVKKEAVTTPPMQPNLAFQLKFGRKPAKLITAASAPKHAQTSQPVTPEALKRKRDSSPQRPAHANDTISTPSTKQCLISHHQVPPPSSAARSLPSPQSSDEAVRQRPDQRPAEPAQRPEGPPRKKKPATVLLMPKKRVL